MRLHGAVVAWVLLPAVLAGASGPLAAAGPEAGRALAALDACRARLDPQVDVGYERIARRCPDLARQLEDSDWAQWLPASWREPRNDLSAGSLAELRTLIERELAARASGPRLDVATLDAVLERMNAQNRGRGGLWDRFRSWLRRILETGRDSEEESWLDRLMGRAGLAQETIELITYVALGATVLLALLIVANELRASGLVRRRLRMGRAAAGGRTERPRLTWRDIERAASADRPRLLLELLVDRLARLGRLPPAAALTARELADSATLDEADRARLGALALAAERVRFAPRPPEPAVLEPALAGGRELLQRLERDFTAVRP